MMSLVKQCCAFWLLLAACLVTRCHKNIFQEEERKAKGQDKTRLIARFLEMKLCKTEEASASEGNFTLVPVGEYVLVDGDVNYRKPSKTLTLLDVRITRCIDAVSFNTCEYYDTWKYGVGVCSVLTAKGFPWSTFVAKYNPPIKCPFKSGHYSFRHAGVDISALQNFLPKTVENSIWIAQMQIFGDASHLVICLNFTADFKRVRIINN